MLCPPNGEADSDLMGLDAALIGAGTSERDWEGEEGAVSTPMYRYAISLAVSIFCFPFSFFFVHIMFIECPPDYFYFFI